MEGAWPVLNERLEVWCIDGNKVCCRFVDSRIAEFFFNTPNCETFRTREEALSKLDIKTNSNIKDST